MFVCQRCEKPSQPGEPLTRIVVETRAVTYSDGYKGTETVKEIGICTACRSDAPNTGSPS